MYRIKINYSLFKQTKRFFAVKLNDPIYPVEEAHNLFKNNKKALFVDVRDPEDYKISHIPGSVNINDIYSYTLSTSDKKGKEEIKAKFEQVFQKAGLSPGLPVVTYEDTQKTHLAISSRAWYILKTLGHDNVKVLDGGFGAWKNNNFPVNNEMPKSKNGNFKIKWNEELWAGKEDILRAVKDPKFVTILDVRDDEEWKGQNSSSLGKNLAPRKGRIPGAVHLNWKEFMTIKDGNYEFKSLDDIEEVCMEYDLSADNQIILYSYRGSRSSTCLIALKRAGFKNVTNYFTSWNEWSNDKALPIDDKIKD